MNLKFVKSAEEKLAFRDELQNLIYEDKVTQPEAIELCIKEGHPEELYFRIGFDSISLLLGSILNENVSPNDFMAFIENSEEGKAIAYECLWQITFPEKPHQVNQPEEFQMAAQLLERNSASSNEKVRRMLDWFSKEVKPEAFRSYRRSLASYYGSDYKTIFGNAAFFKAIQRFYNPSDAYRMACQITKCVESPTESVKYSFFIENDFFEKYRSERRTEAVDIDAFSAERLPMAEALREEHLKKISEEGAAVGYRETRLCFLMSSIKDLNAHEYSIFSEWSEAIAKAFIRYLEKPTLDKVIGLGSKPTHVLKDVQMVSERLCTLISDETAKRLNATLVSAFLSRFPKQVEQASKEGKKAFIDFFSARCDWALALKLGGKKLEQPLASHFGYEPCFADLLSTQGKRAMLGHDLNL